MFLFLLSRVVFLLLCRIASMSPFFGSLLCFSLQTESQMVVQKSGGGHSIHLSDLLPRMFLLNLACQVVGEGPDFVLKR